MTEPPAPPTPRRPVRVLLVDDDALVRAGLRLMLGGDPEIEVVGELADGARVTAAVRELRPDVVLMDIRMPVVDGITATRQLAAESPGEAGARVVVLTTFGTDDNVVAAVRAGAAGFLPKDTDPAEIVAAVRRAARGEPAVSPDAIRGLMRHAAAVDPAERKREAARARLARLTERERDVARAVAEGLSNGEIARRLAMSVGTVKAHISSALTKLDLENRIQLALLSHDAR